MVQVVDDVVAVVEVVLLVVVKLVVLFGLKILKEISNVYCK